ncbi:hypothetical protein PHYPSEUDO_002397 [Phytophthora pseudosyringae]|uniref:Uncharacterized protein n=1 Tax=Phytophthora pseudosyringae TaxID=221518 RepID=A0A8T1VXM9_9STRA|nr:hypothetical protein PHYPSEUDO_002397 [Phytophthora pseudosyringae]
MVLMDEILHVLIMFYDMVESSESAGLGHHRTVPNTGRHDNPHELKKEIHHTQQVAEPERGEINHQAALRGNRNTWDAGYESSPESSQEEKQLSCGFTASIQGPLNNRQS